MRYYPVFLDLNGKTVVVIGGGNIAHQKMENLIKVGAEVTVISPDLNEPMAALKAEGRFRHIEREYQTGDLEGYTLAFVATDDRAVNSAVADEGKARGVWVNAVDDPPYCDFIMPGIVQRGDLVIAISTSGRSPAMARKMREELTDFLSEEWVAMLELAAEVRAELRTRDIMVDSDTWNAALDDELRHLLRENRYDEARQRLLRNLRQPVSGS
ncbi:MAG TPA: bifunctional precorrin-2 dehydrogenase/sirohydrochlorin ferrochelatase [Dehalococcoidia bacterium]|nr:bifunctional precorrin-2 dehydrogenase/sirohydrochlorin ferrochelatase [Dehalococcoidia bacterium]